MCVCVFMCLCIYVFVYLCVCVFMCLCIYVFVYLCASYQSPADIGGYRSAQLHYEYLASHADTTRKFSYPALVLKTCILLVIGCVVFCLSDNCYLSCDMKFDLKLEGER